MRRSNLYRRGMPTAIASLGLVLSGAVGCSAASGQSAALRWSVDWRANFSGSYQAAPDSRVWKYDTGYGIFGNGEVETMTNNPGNVYLDGHGNLDITAVGEGDSWSSGRIETKRLFAAPAGGEMMVTASIRQPSAAGGLGYWPAFWMLGRGSWPKHGEIDIMEDVNALDEHSATLHCGNLTAPNGDGTFGPCREHSGLSSGLRPCPACQASYHTYSVVIDRRNQGAEQVRWYLDRREFFSVKEARVGAANWSEAVDHRFAIILDLAMGGTFPDEKCGCSAPDSGTTSGGTMSVRSLAVYTARPVAG